MHHISKWNVYLLINFFFSNYNVYSQFSKNTYNYSIFLISEHKSNIFLNISSFLYYTDSVTIFDTATSESSRQHRLDLLKYINDLKTVNLMIIGHNDYKKRDKDLLINKISKPHIIFILYETYETLQKSLNDAQFIPFHKSSRSFLILTVTDEILEGIKCSNNSNKFDEVLKKKTGDSFQVLWKNYRCLETIILFSNVCGKRKILRYDPIIQGAEEKPSLGVNFVTDEDILNNRRALRHFYYTFNGYPLKITLFERVPTLVHNMPQSFLSSYLQKDVNIIGNKGGIDGFLLSNMAKYLNFSLNIIKSADGIEYGYELDNGTFTGTLGDIVSQRADISFNARFLLDYESTELEFTFPIYTEDLCILVPKSKKIPQWMKIFQVFRLDVWEITIIVVIACGVFWGMMRILSSGRKLFDAMFCCQNVMDSTLLIISQPIFLPTLTRERIFIASCLLFNIILSGTFQGYLYTAFTTTSYYPEINTLKALDDSGLPVATSSSQLLDIFTSDLSPLFTRLDKKMMLIKTAAIHRAAHNRDVSAVERRSDAALLINMNYSGSHGEPMLHIVKQCPRTFHLSYLVHRNYPFLLHIDRFLRRATEGGLTKFWYDMTVYSIVIHRKKKSDRSSTLEKLSLLDVQTAFITLFSGLVISLVVFLSELMYFFLKKHERTTEMKYALEQN